MANVKDLREHIKLLEEQGKLVRISRPINKDTELMPFVRLQFRGLAEEDRKGFLFENVVDVKGRKYGMPVVVGIVAGSRDIYALGMGCKSTEINEVWAQALSKQLEPKLVPSGPVHDVVIMGDDLYKDGNGIEKIPIPISTPGFDNAPYTTATHWVTKDLDTGIRNVGNYRSQVKAKDRLGIFVHPTQHIKVHWDKASQKGVPLQAALVMGGAPSIAYAAGAKVPYGVDELAVAGGLTGAPLELVKCKTIDMEVPANAEIVIEGELDTEYLEPEAPFGEYCGYMGERVLNPFVRIRCITHRRDAFYHAIISQMPPSESSKLRHITFDAIYYKFLRYDCNIPTVRDVAFHESSGAWNYLVIQMDKKNPGQPWQALNAAAAFDVSIGKIIIVVDGDIDARDPESVNWALSFRMMPHRDTRITMGKGASLDHSAAPPGSMSHEEMTFPTIQGTSALLIDATRKWAYPPVSLPRREFMENALELWEAEGLPPLKLKTPWYGYELGYWEPEFAEEAELALQGEHYRTGQKFVEQRQKIR